VSEVIRWLRAEGWEVDAEVTFSIAGERGSVDVLAFHPASGALLVVEVKSVVADVQGTLAGLDRTARLAVAIARGRGWRPTSISRLLVLPEDRTARRRVDRHRATFDAALPARTNRGPAMGPAPERPAAGDPFRRGRGMGRARHRVAS
jgi:hypothetical protein